MFHGTYAIASEVAPQPPSSADVRWPPPKRHRLGSSQLRQIRCSYVVFNLQRVATLLATVFHTSGTKLAVTASPQCRPSLLDDFLAELYLLFADYVLKKPFYDLGQPVHGCDEFVQQLEETVGRMFSNY